MKSWFACLAVAGLVLQADDMSFEVRQVATEVVYIALPQPDVLREGDQLTVLRGEQLIASLEVVSVSSKYAGCKVLESTEPLAVGDLALFKGRPKQTEVSEADVSEELKQEARTPERPRRTVARQRRPVRGTVSLQYHHFAAALENRDYSQPTFRVNLRASELMDGRMGFRLRTRSRYRIREKPGAPKETEWNNRIYEASLSLGRNEDRFQFQVGRLISRKFSGAGYIDGALAGMKVGSSSSVGLFAGQQPQWQQSDTAETLTKYGAYFNFKRSAGDRVWSSVVAVSGEYAGSEVSREYVYLANRFNQGARFSIYQSAELDLNRDWRADRADSSVDLSNLFIQGRYRFSERLSWSLGYDNRRQYYTYELRNQDEAFFDNLTRSGWRTSLRGRLWQHLRWSAGAGLRTQENREDTKTWHASVYHPKVLTHLSVRARWHGFTNPYTKGTRQTLQLGKRWRQGHNLYIGTTLYDYSWLQTGEDRTNHYLRLEGYLALGRHLFFNGQWEHSTGDDAEGDRIYLELGLRL